MPTKLTDKRSLCIARIGRESPIPIDLFQDVKGDKNEVGDVNGVEM